MLNRHPQKFQFGVSLIESMVALLVISIGLLGIAALQISAMKQNSSAYWHSQSVWIAYDMADRIRANFIQFNGYIGTDTSTGYSQDCETNACSPAQILIDDQQALTDQVSSLPSGRALITSLVANQLNITVMWDDDGTGATGTGCSNDTSADLTCYLVTVAQ